MSAVRGLKKYEFIVWRKKLSLVPARAMDQNKFPVDPTVRTRVTEPTSSPRPTQFMHLNVDSIQGGLRRPNGDRMQGVLGGGVKGVP